ncbi:protein TIC 40, chloroplastic-like [Hibiscus syriacus]|uniref:protein TIC 40, chloroplastic-like n=1 Tax=Hibiscus syriacus TaxID=106335 RepID=UPI0019250A96|nr:protein TIC 40, chloroplastic-like [Hibiscus syriacus]
MALVSVSPSPSKFYLLGHTNNPIYNLKAPTKIFIFPTPNTAPRRSRVSCSAHPTRPRRLSQIVFGKSGDERFASISSSSNQQTSSVGVDPYPTVPPPSSQM